MKGKAFRIGSSNCAEIQKNECGAILPQDAGKGAPGIACRRGWFILNSGRGELTLILYHRPREAPFVRIEK
jgi:hypothetical protein